MTHAELVERAKKWMLSGYKDSNRHRQVKCGFVLTEPSNPSSEIPDAIGWTRYRSVLVECKVSRSDFLSDKKKPHRQCSAIGMGSFRFYFCQPGIINVEDLPEKWGLAWCYPKIVKVKKLPEEFDHVQVLLQERVMIYSVMRRIHFNADMDKITRFMGRENK